MTRAEEKFSKEYPTHPNVIGSSVKTTRDFKFDKEYLNPDARKSSSGKIVDYSNSHGLCFRIKHDDGNTAWYEPSEVKPL